VSWRLIFHTTAGEIWIILPLISLTLRKVWSIIWIHSFEQLSPTTNKAVLSFYRQRIQWYKCNFFNAKFCFEKQPLGRILGLACPGKHRQRTVRPHCSWQRCCWKRSLRTGALVPVTSP